MNTSNIYKQNFEVAPVGGGIKFQIKGELLLCAFFTIFMLLLFISVSAIEARSMKDFLRGASRLVLLLGVGISVWGILLGGIHHSFRPRLYSLNAIGVTIKRAIRNVHIPYSEITRTTIVDSAPLWWGIGTPLDLDKPASAYVTCSERLLLIETAKRRYYLSPLEPEEMLRAIQQRLEEKK